MGLFDWLFKKKEMTKKEVLELWFKKVWFEEDKLAIREFFKPESTADKAFGLDKKDGMDPSEYEAFHGMFLKIAKEVTLTIESYIEQGDFICAITTVSAKDRKEKTAGTISMKGSVICKVKNGKIVSAENFFDFISFFEQLGQLPENTLGKCFAGEKIG